MRIQAPGTTLVVGPLIAVYYSSADYALEVKWALLNCMNRP